VLTSRKKLIPPEIKWDADAVPPQYTDHAEQIIEKGTNLRVKLIGLRNDVRNMFAIGSIKEDYLGYDNFPESRVMRVKLTGLAQFVGLSEATIKQNPLRGISDHTAARPGVMQLSVTLACTSPSTCFKTRSLLLSRHQDRGDYDRMDMVAFCLLLSDLWAWRWIEGVV
jgi:hypothetical protein